MLSRVGLKDTGKIKGNVKVKGKGLRLSRVGSPPLHFKYLAARILSNKNRFDRPRTAKPAPASRRTRPRIPLNRQATRDQGTPAVSCQVRPQAIPEGRDEGARFTRGRRPPDNRKPAEGEHHHGKPPPRAKPGNPR